MAGTDEAAAGPERNGNPRDSGGRDVDEWNVRRKIKRWENIGRGNVKE